MYIYFRSRVTEIYIQTSYSSKCEYCTLISVFGEIGTGKHRFLWNDPKDRQTTVRHEFFNYDGVPYLTVGTYTMGCQYGAPEAEYLIKRRENKRVGIRSKGLSR